MADPGEKNAVERSRAVVLLSGGLDSATCLAIARRDLGNSGEVHALTVAYGQRHAHELDAASSVARALRADSHRTVQIDLRCFGGSALTGDIDVPKSDAAFGGGEPSGIPVTYVPARNTIFLSYALAYAEVLDAGLVYIGVNAVDYSGYPDCRPEYIAAFQAMSDLATKAGIEGHGPQIQTPLIGMPKTEIIRLGLELGVDYGLTSSCYDPGAGGAPCGRCDSCRIRAAAFGELGLADPASPR